MYPIVDLVEHQVIAAVEKEDGLEEALQSKCNVIFLLCGTIFTVQALVERIKQAGKHVFVHMEFVEGIAADRSGVTYIAHTVRPTGIISTKSAVIRLAREQGLMTIQRIFLIDRSALERGVRSAETSKPDAIEAMPGIMPRIIGELTQMTELPIVAGGLISTGREIDDTLQAGALAVSAGSPVLWNHEVKAAAVYEEDGR